MIFLTKLNNEQFVLNCDQIQTIEVIPDSKLTLLNEEQYIVKESPEEILERIIEYRRMSAGQLPPVIRRELDPEPGR